MFVNKSMRKFLWAGAAVAVPAMVNAYIAARVARLDQPLPGDIGYYDWVYGRVAFYRMGHGEPVVLVHNPNMGGSAWEWRHIFPDLANHYTVYAFDLLGFGMSDKPNLGYTGALYADLLHDFLQDVVGQRTALIASNLASSYAVNVAVRRPEVVERLLLVNPTGCTAMLPSYAEGVVATTMRIPVLGTSAYYSLVTRASLEHELRARTYYDSCMVTPELVDRLYRASHQRGAQYAAGAFIAGALDLPMRLAFADLRQPTLMAWGRDAYYTPVSDAADLVYRHPQARLEVFDDCGMLPHDERAGDFLRLVRRFLSEPGPGIMAA